MSDAFFVQLPSRGRVTVAGPDRLAFLQAIASNDLRLLQMQPSVYSCLLTPQGKFLFDFFVREDGEALVLDCEGGARVEALAKELKKYKLRSKVELGVEGDVPTYASLPGLSGQSRGTPEIAPVALDHPDKPGDDGYFDPRSPLLGYRTSAKPNLFEKSLDAWDAIRIPLAIPDGSRDMQVGQDTLLDCNIDVVHGLSHDKGCYVGQEITARMHLRGLVKKHLRAVTIKGQALAPFSDITIGGTLVGQMRSSAGGIGLALLKDEALPLLEQADSPLSLLGAAS